VNGRQLQRINGWHLAFWAAPGLAINWFLRNQLWWTNFMSWFAIVLTVGTMWSASRTEAKQDQADTNGGGDETRT
jgi:heme/copper-type cytochrome/quinol oxidase subunit 2